VTLRADLAHIARWIRPASRVLDLGCGDGALLAHLAHARRCTGYGLEIADDNVVRAIGRGVDVIQLDLDEGLPDFEDGSFDYVVMAQTLQAVRHPGRLLGEMLRVGAEGIVTFPNFGHWRSRFDIALRGRMPVSPALPHQWHDTPNIHLCTLRDFEALCRAHGIRVLERAVLDHAHRARLAARLAPNLMGEIALYRFERDGAARTAPDASTH
jgi:methionine biosynthesis protein MetW